MATSTQVSRHLRNQGLHPGNTESNSEGIKVHGSKRDVGRAYITVNYDNPSTRARLGDAIREALDASTWDYEEKITDPDSWDHGLHRFHITGVNPDKARAARRARDAKRRAERAEQDRAEHRAKRRTAVAKAAPGATHAELRARAESVERAAVAAAAMTPEQRTAARDIIARHRTADTTATPVAAPVAEPGRYLIALPGKAARAVYITDTGAVQDMVTRRLLTTAQGADDFLAVLGDQTDAREAAQAFGRMFGICGRCGTELTMADSQERGLGPDCAKAMGL